MFRGRKAAAIIAWLSEGSWSSLEATASQTAPQGAPRWPGPDQCHCHPNVKKKNRLFVGRQRLPRQ